MENHQTGMGLLMMNMKKLHLTHQLVLIVEIPIVITRLEQGHSFSTFSWSLFFLAA